MCGIVGVAGKLAVRDEALMKRLFLLDYFRGTDSTGFAAVKPNGDTKIAKICSHPLDLFEHAGFKSALSGIGSDAFIGHNRSATKGAVSTFNAHPFNFGSITGVHNGTLTTDSLKALNAKIGENYLSDSMALYDCIGRHGIKETMPLVEGAWALVWHDKEDDSINFLRNDERPLWYAWSDKFDQLFWASEWQMLQAATSIHNGNNPNSKYELHKNGEGYTYFEADADTWFSINITALRKGDKEGLKPSMKTLKGKGGTPTYSSYHPFTAQTGGNTTTTRQGSSTFTHRSGTSGSRLTDKEKKEKKDTSASVHLFRDHNPLDEFITRDKFDEIAKYGCCFCQADVTYDDVGLLIIERDGIVLCSECSNTEKTRFVTSDVSKAIMNG